MRNAFFVLGIASFTAAQLSAVPPCASSCPHIAAIDSGCGLTDYACQCTAGQAEYIASLTSCVCKSTCSEGQQVELHTALNNLCEASIDGYNPVPFDPNACGGPVDSSSTHSSIPVSTSTTSILSASSSFATSISPSSIATSTSGLLSASSSAASSAAPTSSFSTRTSTQSTDFATLAAASATATHSPPPPARSRLSAGAAAGIGVGATLAGIAVLGLAAFYILRRRKRPRSEATRDNKATSDTTVDKKEVFDSRPHDPHDTHEEKPAHLHGTPIHEVWNQPAEMEGTNGTRPIHELG